MTHLRPDQLSTLLAISKRTIYRALDEGWLEKVTVRGQTRVIIPQEVQTMAPGDRLLKPAEVARTFKVSVSAIYRWAAEGKLDFVKIAGHTIRILESSVKNIIADI